MSKEEHNNSVIKNWNKIIRKIWDDPQMKDELLQNPHAILKKHGIIIPDDIKIEIHENSENKRHFVLPEKPKKELSDDFLSHIVAGLYYAP